MLTFEAWIDVREKIGRIIADIKALPDQDVDADIWQEKNNKKICFDFFETIMKHLPNAELEQLLSQCNLDGNYLEIYRKLNSPGHPVREYLIVHAPPEQPESRRRRR